MKLPTRLRSRSEDKLRRRFEAALQRLGATAPDSEDVLQALAALVAVLRPRRARDIASAEQRIGVLTAMLAADEAQRSALRRALMSQFAQRRPLRLLTDCAVMSEEGFFSGLWRRVGQRMLPEEADPSQLRDVLRLLFPRRDDHLWVNGVADALWIGLLDTLRLSLPASDELALHMAEQMLEALQVVSYRIAAIGLDPELVRNHPAIERYTSPFVMQNVELRDFLEERRLAVLERRDATLDDKHLLVLLDQCDTIIGKVRRQAETTGTSMRLAALLLRLRDLIDRQHALLRMCEQRDPHAHNVDRVALFKRMVRAETLRYDIGEWCGKTIEMLALRITHNASKTGEKYITETPAEYLGMFRSAMGAGFIVAFMALLKIQMSSHPFAPLVQALLYSLNYGLGFVLIYLCHFTIATKQPAMTASTIARALDQPSGGGRIEALTDLIVCTARSQFIAVAGNVLLAFSTALLVGWAVLMQTDAHAFGPDKALKLLTDTSPLRSLAVFHAGLAGVCLFLAGLIAGYYDNRAVYGRIGERVGQRPFLRRWLGRPRAERLGGYVGANLGAICGNFFFGCMLGSMGALGTILGLPLDIRHVTFSTANVAYALFALDFHVELRLAAEALCGIFVIATVNLVVSFSLALFVAMRAQRVQFGETGTLIRSLLARLGRTPTQFFWPPRSEPDPGPGS